MNKQILLVGNPLNTPRKFDHWRAMIDEHMRTSCTIHYLQVGNNVTEDSLSAIEKLGAVPVRPDSGQDHIVSPARLESYQNVFFLFFPTLAFLSLKKTLNAHFGEKTAPDFLVILPGFDETSFVGYVLAHYYKLEMVLLDQFSFYQRGIVSRRKAKIIRKISSSCAVIYFKCRKQLEAFDNLVEVSSKKYLWPDPIPYQFEMPPAQGDGPPSFKRLNGKGIYMFAAWSNWNRSLKRLDLLLDAFRLVRRENPCVSLIVAGPIPDKISSNRKIMSDPHIVFTGAVDRQTIKALAYNVDCAVVPSDFETFSLPTLEALVGGTPVIATACGGPEDIIRDPMVGTIVEPSDLSSLATAMTRASSGLAGYGSREWIRRYTLRRYSRQRASVKWQEYYGATSGHIGRPT